MMRAILLLASSAYASAFSLPCTAAITRSRAAATMMADQFRWSKAKVGSKVDLKEAPSDISWARAAWAAASEELKPDECYLISPEDSPDSEKDYYFCSAPSSDAKMTCEEMPEWMGTAADGSTVYICTVAKA